MCAAERADEQNAGAAIEDEFEAPEKGSATELLDANAHDALDPMRHSAAHIMAEAVMDLFPEARLGIGPAIKDGFYYDFDLPRALTPQDLKAIEKRMKKSVGRNHPFERREWDPDEGRAMLADAGQTYKVEILDDLRAAAQAAGEPVPPVSTYTHGPSVVARTSSPPERSVRSSCSRSPAPTGGAMRSGPCSSASTAPSGTPRRSWTSTSGGWRRRASAITAASA